MCNKLRHEYLDCTISNNESNVLISDQVQESTNSQVVQPRNKPNTFVQLPRSDQGD